MQNSRIPNQKRAPKLRRTVRAVKSGFRRYPRAIYDSFKKSSDTNDPIHLPEILHELVHHDLAVLWLGHGSVVGQVDDVTVTVDPVLSDRIGMRIKGRTIGISRLIPAPVSPESLIGSDIVLITHAHFDHLDKPTLEGMKSDSTIVITPVRCSKLIPSGFEQVIELKPGTTIKVKGLCITAIEPKHWGARALFDRRRGVNSYLVESTNQRVLFTGDTAETEIYQGLDQIDLAVFGIGAYDPWDHMHATPEQAWRMFQGIDAKYMLPIHHSTFDLGEEPNDEPLRRLYSIASSNADSIIEPIIGEIIVINTPVDFSEDRETSAPD
jgi:L-ascorbate metabolism protein UlaG (beta-lactamase superfamily)